MSASDANVVSGLAQRASYAPISLSGEIARRVGSGAVAIYPRIMPNPAAKIKEFLTGPFQPPRALVCVGSGETVDRLGSVFDLANAGTA